MPALMMRARRFAGPDTRGEVWKISGELTTCGFVPLPDNEPGEVRQSGMRVFSPRTVQNF